MDWIEPLNALNVILWLPRLTPLKWKARSIQLGFNHVNFSYFFYHFFEEVEFTERMYLSGLEMKYRIKTALCFEYHVEIEIWLQLANQSISQPDSISTTCPILEEPLSQPVSAERTALSIYFSWKTLLFSFPFPSQPSICSSR